MTRHWSGAIICAAAHREPRRSLVHGDRSTLSRLPVAVQDGARPRLYGPRPRSLQKFVKKCGIRIAHLDRHGRAPGGRSRGRWVRRPRGRASRRCDRRQDARRPRSEPPHRRRRPAPRRVGGPWASSRRGSPLLRSAPRGSGRRRSHRRRPRTSPARSSTGPCSICSSTKAVKRSGATSATSAISAARRRRSGRRSHPRRACRRPRKGMHGRSRVRCRSGRRTCPPRPGRRRLRRARPFPSRAARASSRPAATPSAPSSQPPRRLRVGVGAHKDRRPVARSKPKRLPARSIPHLEARLPHSLREPAPRRDVGVREGGARDTCPHAADRAEVVERRQNPGGVDRDRRCLHRVPLRICGRLPSGRNVRASPPSRRARG